MNFLKKRQPLFLSLLILLFAMVIVYYDKKGNESVCVALEHFDRSNIYGKVLSIKTSNSAYTISIENDPKEYLVLIKNNISNGKYFRAVASEQNSIVEKKKHDDYLKVTIYGKIYEYEVYRTLGFCD